MWWWMNWYNIKSWYIKKIINNLEFIKIKIFGSKKNPYNRNKYDSQWGENDSVKTFLINDLFKIYMLFLKYYNVKNNRLKEKSICQNRCLIMEYISVAS